MARSKNLLRRQKGFTFNEVLVALSIIVFVVMGYSLSTVGVIRGRNTNDNLTVALYLAQDKMEELKAQTKLVNDNRCPSAGDRGISATGAAGGIFDRCWKITGSGLGANLKQADVTVSWRDYDQHQVTVRTLILAGAYP